MITKSKMFLALALTLGATGGVALANGGGRGGKPEMIEKYDTNKDGKLDDAEKAKMKADFQAKHAAMKAKRLAQFDTNRDGKLDDNERAVMKDTRATEHFKKLDTNNDGQISLAEFKAAKGPGGHHGRHGGHRGPHTK